MMNEYNINQTTLKILGLYRNDYRLSLHLREIARRTNVDVKAIQMQARRLEGANILTSATRGRNREFSLNIENHLTRYHMLLAEAFASITFVTAHFSVKKVATSIGDRIDGILILFGSFAKGTADEESDVDLFAVTEREIDADVIEETSKAIGREICVKSANRDQFLRGLEEGDSLVKEVVSNHVLLKRIDEFCEIMWRYHARERRLPGMVPR